MQDKEEWILNYISNKSNLKFVDILDEEFVYGFIEKFNTRYEASILGAPRCKELSSILSKMYKKGLLSRFTHGVRSGLHQDGKFPKWVYSYKLP